MPGGFLIVSVSQRTSSGRVEFLALTGNRRVTVSGLTFRLAVGREPGWEG